ncbi:saccharopine dehydrogenase family protein [Streptomyces sp. ST2-7A]|uniref:saccharopine dehydrogenase family protein n=1 Tax=Streptomyces sp. ST2-7A TaxID=2907214 RepID=UPI001F210903|nr:saccharopine dehydrogenase family protein [Streptomyces sp. ST2-7A]MCE7079401.1 saccharopine dehydrogenase NADP-binding domain-containing protein [Streptomyces sp. ST2-7A]
MTDVIAPTGTVHWMGAGLSTGSGLAAVLRTAPQVRLWHRSVDRAEKALDRLGLSGRVAPRAFTPEALSAELAPGDIVVSMLPASEHDALLHACVGRRAHFACSSYASDTMRELAPAAAANGTVILAEAGLDPGIDHLFAHSLIGRAGERWGDAPARVRFTSYCGGVPAVPNAFRYRFNWAPRGVLGALRTPARYVADGARLTAARPWEVAVTQTVGGETFEMYPNRDSVPFIAQYGLPPQWSVDTFVRGTLRLGGWLNAWEPVFAELRRGDDTRIASLADELAARHPTTDSDRDRVVLRVSLDVRSDAGDAWEGHYLLDTVGDAAESAMARCVSRPLADGVEQILHGLLPVGLTCAARGADESEQILARLAGQGIDFTRHLPD